MGRRGRQTGMLCAEHEPNSQAPEIRSWLESETAPQCRMLTTLLTEVQFTPPPFYFTFFTSSLSI